MIGTIFTRVSFYPAVMWGYLMSRVTERKWYNRIDDTVVLGALPLRKSVAPVLVGTENIRAVISLVEPYETRHIPNNQEWTDLGIKDFLWLPTQDFWGAPTQVGVEKALEVVDMHRRAQTSVYIHCKAGRTRSASLVVCYLIKRYSLTPADALELLKSRRPHVWFRGGQMTAIHQFYDSLVREGNFQPKDLRNHPDIRL